LAQVVSLSKTGSIINLWVQEPRFSNADGTISLEGLAFNPAYQGSTGKILTVNLIAAAPGETVLTLASGSVLANDGSGTNILGDMTGATFNISRPAAFGTVGTTAEGGAKTVSPASLPPAPQIESATHPDRNQWYASDSAEFSWEIPEGVEVVSLLVGNLPEMNPTTEYAPPVSSKRLDNLESGIWYLYVKFKNENGWGPVGYYSFKVDRESPSIPRISVLNANDQQDRPIVALSSRDSLSGLDYYKVWVGASYGQTMSPSEAERFMLPGLQAGRYTLEAEVFDKAGNSTKVENTLLVEKNTSGAGEGSAGVVYSLESGGGDNEEVNTSTLWIFLIVAVVLITSEFIWDVHYRYKARLWQQLVESEKRVRVVPNGKDRSAAQGKKRGTL